MLMTEIAFISVTKQNHADVRPVTLRVTSHTCWTGLSDRIFRQLVI